MIACNWQNDALAERQRSDLSLTHSHWRSIYKDQAGTFGILGRGRDSVDGKGKGKGTEGGEEHDLGQWNQEW